ncbi:MAG: Rieske 2Fe-2S domain-containing protein [Acidimicrobiales bacterium]|nr:Rieske 2Fe-2S domain-containing protein [Acidimicrobiales bacterium]
MQITYIGHAGLYLDSECGSILCDPWFNSAYLASWFPYPSNKNIDIESISKPNYLYISHLHLDHFDPAFLKKYISKQATVLLPEFGTSHMRDALSDLGFKYFIDTKNGEDMVLDGGYRVMVNSLSSPTDGPLGDSVLAVDDGVAKVLNQNDARPTNLALLNNFGVYDAHFLQFSGAIWFPMVYRYDKNLKDRLARAKRKNQLERACQYVKAIGAKNVFPSAGPPCFLDESLFELNDFSDPSSLNGSETNIFCDARVFIGHLLENGIENSHLIGPNSKIKIGKEYLDIDSPEDLRNAYEKKRQYLVSYQEQVAPQIEAEKKLWPKLRSGEMFQIMKEWFEPLIKSAPLTCRGINGRILLSSSNGEFVLDFLTQEVEPYEGQSCRFRFYFQDGVMEYCLANRVEDWVNMAFLSCRFEAEREGPYNEYVYSFFKSLSEMRMEFVENYYSRDTPVGETIECEGYKIQRYCPHLRADLTEFGYVENGVLTCKLHGWRFDLDSGKCLTSQDRKLFSEPID